MVQKLAAEILTGDSDEIADLKANLSTLEGFIELAREIDSLPNTKKRFFEESRSLFQTTALGRGIDELESFLTKFFGSAVKPAGKPLPRKLRKNSVVKYLGGIQKDQSLFIMSLKTGQFYGALWPWRRNKSKIEVHLGYCSDWMSDEDYDQIETLVSQCISHSTFQTMDAGIGGQIHGISLPSFLQMAEMEKSSFSLRITSLNRVGNLYLDEGVLIDAEIDDIKGAEAAYQIISWDEASIQIDPPDASKKDNIKQPLMQVLMESLKLKDEAVTPKAASDELQPDDLEGVMPTAAKPKPRSERPSPGRLVRLERAPEPKIKGRRFSLLTFAAIALGTLGIVAVIFFASLRFANERKASDGYEKLLAQVESTRAIEQKLTLLQKYLDTYPNSQHTADIQTKIATETAKIADREFDQVQLKISAMPVDEKYEKKAIAIYQQYLEKYPNSHHKKEINIAIGKIKNLIDQFYYAELKQAARLDFSERITIYQNYLAKFPKGSYGKDVEILIEEMGKSYLAYLEKEAVQCEAKRLWDPCIKHFDTFIKAYQGQPLGQAGTTLKAKMVDKRDLIELRRQVLDAGTDYQKGYQLYQSYLEKNPQSTQKEAIEKEIANLESRLKTQERWIAVKQYAQNPKNSLIRRIQKVDRYLKKNLSGPYAGDAQSMLYQLDAERKISLRQQQALSKQRKEQERIQREKELKAQQQQRIRRLRSQVNAQLSNSKRFRPNRNGTVLDQSTGLTWTLLDSFQELGDCLSYEAAQAYVQHLSIGDQRNWRLPTASELATLYKKAPFYPSKGNQWYWSSETYAKGYHSVVVVVTDKPETVFKRENRTMTECGVVRAVR